MYIFSSLVLDEPLDIGSVSQLVCFMRFAPSDATTEEDFGCYHLLVEQPERTYMKHLCSFSLRTMVIFINLYQLLLLVHPPWWKEKNTGLIAYLMEDYRIPNYVHNHRLIYVDVICCRLKNRTKSMSCLETIIKVDYMTWRPLNKWLLMVFLEDSQAPDSQPIVHAEVRLLSRGKALARVWQVLHEPPETKQKLPFIP